jgi:hypothetical protein
MRINTVLVAALLFMLANGARGADTPTPSLSPAFTKPGPITMAELAEAKTSAVSVSEVSDYVFGGYTGDFKSPPHADGNPRKAFIIQWKDRPYRFVFSHEGSYCPWFEFPSGAGASFQWWEGNDGWAEPLCDFGRLERNSFVDIIDRGPERVWVRWTYLSPNPQTGEIAYRGTEDFWAYPNGLILRRQTYETLRPGDHHGYSREPMELIGLAPVGKLWSDVLRKVPGSEERHSLAALDVFSDDRYDTYWTPKAGTLWDSTRRRDGCTWKEIDDAKGIALVLPLVDGSAFCIFGDASGFRRAYTRVKEHSFPETGGSNWGSMCWDHWPIGWINSRGMRWTSNRSNFIPITFRRPGWTFSRCRTKRRRSSSAIRCSASAAKTSDPSAPLPAAGWKKARPLSRGQTAVRTFLHS